MGLACGFTLCCFTQELEHWELLSFLPGSNTQTTKPFLKKCALEDQQKSYFLSLLACCQKQRNDDNFVLIQDKTLNYPNSGPEAS